MKATKVEVYLQPRFIQAAAAYLITGETLYWTELPNGVLLVTTMKATDLALQLAMLQAYVNQYTSDPIHVLQSPTVYERLENATR